MAGMNEVHYLIQVRDILNVAFNVFSSSAELGQCGPGGRLSSSPFGEEKMKAAGRSKLILATWLRNRSHEPPVGQLGAGATNGLSHHSSQSGSSSSDEHGTRELAKKNGVYRFFMFEA